MAAESNLRKTEYLKKGCNSFNSDWPASTPLGFWTEQDIYQYIKEFDVPYCSVYGDILQDSKLYKGFDMIAVERLNGINNREGVENRNKMFKELLIANYPIKELYERQAD